MLQMGGLRSGPIGRRGGGVSGSDGQLVFHLANARFLENELFDQDTIVFCTDNPLLGYSPLVDDYIDGGEVVKERSLGQVTSQFGG